MSGNDALYKVLHNGADTLRVGEREDGEFQFVPCAEISIPAKRYRRDMGDLAALAASIGQLGLLHPIGVTPARELIFGERRLRAVRDVLGCETIAVHVFDLDLDLSLEAESAENEQRKALTLSEKHDLSLALQARRAEKRGRPKAKKEQSAQSGTLPQRPEAQEKKVDKNHGNRREYWSEETEAREAGFDSAREAQRVATVIEHGTPELVEAMEY